jgi:hypothetical protein
MPKICNYDIASASPYGIYAVRAYKITREQYNYLLPVYSHYTLEERGTLCLFHGTPEQYKDMQRRCAYLD